MLQNNSIDFKLNDCIQRAIAHIQQNNYRHALDFLNEALKLQSNHAQSLLLSAQCLHALGEVSQSERFFLALINADPSNAFYHHSLAILYNDFDQSPKALVHAEQATALAPQQFECWIQLSLAYRQNRRLKEAHFAADKAVTLSDGHPDALRARAYCSLEQNQSEQASSDFQQRMLAYFGKETSSSNQKEFTSTSKAKLKHDIEHFQYLKKITGNSKFDALTLQHQNLLNHLVTELAEDTIVTLLPSALVEMQGNYNRLHHFEQAERSNESALNTARNFHSIEQSYAEHAPGITWIDDFLSEVSLNALRKYCLENSMWFDFHHPNGYLGALMENGFAAPLLFQIAEELKKHLPGIFKDYPLIQMWAFKYDSQLQGIQMHADIAAINLNFWITPDYANLDPNSGGLVIWDKEAPAEWGFSEFNTGEVNRQQRIQDFLEVSGANKITVPYRQNRAVVFNSDLFHSTDKFHFKDGYENRRINITLLFGHR
jgi:tetratricopeptide (TPR) repeat protein